MYCLEKWVMSPVSVMSSIVGRQKSPDKTMGTRRLCGFTWQKAGRRRKRWGGGTELRRHVKLIYIMPICMSLRLPAAWDSSLGAIHCVKSHVWIPGRNNIILWWTAEVSTPYIHFLPCSNWRPPSPPPSPPTPGGLSPPGRPACADWASKTPRLGHPRFRKSFNVGGRVTEGAGRGMGRRRGTEGAGGDGGGREKRLLCAPLASSFPSPLWTASFKCQPTGAKNARPTQPRPLILPLFPPFLLAPFSVVGFLNIFSLLRVGEFPDVEKGTSETVMKYVLLLFFFTLNNLWY